MLRVPKKGGTITALVNLTVEGELMKKNRRTSSVIEIRPVRVTKRDSLGSALLWRRGGSCFPARKHQG